ncbi:MAG: hypothetical protein Ct9H300mP23_11480 [Nitrospinota bacterium]|nr:MAG: hypothetical protein Ct9H300mP23_11480 [Nitrospinota bacterium]
MFKKTDVIFVLFFCCPSLAQAGDLSKLVEKRISQDGTTLDLKGLNIGQKGSKKLAAMESLASSLHCIFKGIILKQWNESLSQIATFN